MIVKRHVNGVSTCCSKACRVYRRKLFEVNRWELLYQCLGCMSWCQLVRTGMDTFEVFLNIDCSDIGR